MLCPPHSAPLALPVLGSDPALSEVATGAKLSRRQIPQRSVWPGVGNVVTRRYWPSTPPQNQKCSGDCSGSTKVTQAFEAGNSDCVYVVRESGTKANRLIPDQELGGSGKV